MRNDSRNPRRFAAAILAIGVHIALALFLIFGVHWQNKRPEAMEVELVQAPSSRVPPPKAEPAPAKTVPPPPPPPAVPPAAPPKAVPPPLKAVPPPPPAGKQETPKPDIALKAKQEKERLERQEREREQVAAAKKESERKARELREAAKKEVENRERASKEAARKQAEQRNTEELKAAQASALKEAEDRQRREAQARLDREQRERQQEQQNARARADADYKRRIQAKIQGNVILPPEIAGNPEGVYEVVQLPTGEIISAEIRKSSGSRAYDDAVLRAILKSSPLPVPKSDVADLFQRNLILKFRPRE